MLHLGPGSATQSEFDNVRIGEKIVVNFYLLFLS